MENAAATATNESNDAPLLAFDGAASFPSSLTALVPGAADDNDVTFVTREALLNMPNAPCSNDNPEWDEATQPCGGVSLEVIFDEAIVTNELGADAGGPDVVDGAGGSDQVSATVPPNAYGADPVADIERFHSCAASSPAELEAEGGVEVLPLGFDYEVYVAPSASAAGDVGAVLSGFELRLADGVAASMGQGECSDSGIGGLGAELQLARRFGGGARRRTLGDGGNWPLDGAGSESLVVGVSAAPPDSLDGAATCSTDMMLAVPSMCVPVAGAMTAWIASDSDDRRGRRLRRGLVGAGAGSGGRAEAVLLDAVRSYIEGEEASYLSDDLLYVAYVGPRGGDGGGEAVADDAGVDAGGALPGPDDAVGSDPVRTDPVGTDPVGTDPDPDGVEDVDRADRANVQVPIEGGGDDVGLDAMLISLSTAAILLVVVLLGAVYLHLRRRRRSRDEAAGALDAESGAFPALTPESCSADGLKPGDGSIATAPTQLENVRSADLFGIKGEPPSDASFQEEGGGDGGRGELVPPSSLAAGPASAFATARHPSLSDPEDAPPQLDMAPTILEASEDDIEPMSPMNPKDEDEDDLSSAFDDLEVEEGGDSAAPARSRESSLERSSQVAELIEMWEEPGGPNDAMGAPADNDGRGDYAGDDASRPRGGEIA